MKFTLSWLKEYLETDADAEQISEQLTSLGLEVESAENKAALLAQFEIAEVIAAEKHPNADRLRYCQVSTNAGEVLKVVCGAPNARAGIKVALARPGHKIPATGIVLKKSEIRGVPSEGMLCSEEELNLPITNAGGILELPPDAPLGVNIAEYLGLNDTTFEIGITPNRGDCLGIYGIARDLAAAGLGGLKPLNFNPVGATIKSPIMVQINDPDCKQFVGRYFKGVNNAQSPDWLKRKLESLGLRPISALVDITNYFTFAFNRPMHVFDADKLNGGIIVRPSTAAEKIKTLNGREYELPENFTVIADTEKAQAIGGIIGGEEGGCSADTSNVFLEVAYFSPLKIAREGRHLDLITDARYRFERGVDPAFLIPAAEMASRMILELCGGQTSELVVAGVEPEWKRSFTLSYDYIRNLSGVDIIDSDAAEILHSLGFQVDSYGGLINVTPPSWRPDISGKADIAEEVLRVFGYDKIPVQLPPHGANSIVAGQNDFKSMERSRSVLAARGMVETCTYSFMDQEHAVLFGSDKPELVLQNPISAELGVMRPSLVPNLLAAAAKNSARGISSGALFEIGRRFTGIQLKEQNLTATAIRYGDAIPRNHHSPTRLADVFDAKADAYACLEALNAPVAKLELSSSTPDYYHPGKSGALSLGKNILAVFGELHPLILKHYDLNNAAACEVFLDALPDNKGKSSTRQPLNISDLPLVERDFAFVVGDAISARDVIRAILNADKVHIKSANVFDVFKGKELPEGHKSMAVQTVIAPLDKTLTDAEINAISQKIVAAVVKATNATIRG